jgi:hypothetical protein
MIDVIPVSDPQIRCLTQRRKGAKIKRKKRIMIRRLRRFSQIILSHAKAQRRKGAKALRYKNNIAQLCGMRMNFEPALNDSISCIGSKF